MVHSCCAYNCTQRFKKGDKISFHSFPKNEILKKEWILATRRKDFEPTVFSKLCSRHFQDSDYERRFGQLKLKEGAVPSVFNFSEKSTKQIKSTSSRKRDSSQHPQPVRKIPKTDDTPINESFANSAQGDDMHRSKERLINPSEVSKIAPLQSVEIFLKSEDIPMDEPSISAAQGDNMYKSNERLINISEVSKIAPLQSIEIFLNTEDIPMDEPSISSAQDNTYKNNVRLSINEVSKTAPLQAVKICVKSEDTPIDEPSPNYSSAQGDDIYTNNAQLNTHEVLRTGCVKRNLRTPVYFGDFKYEQLKSEESKHLWCIADRKIKEQAKEINSLKNKVRRLVLKVKKLEDVMGHLKNSK